MWWIHPNHRLTLIKAGFKQQKYLFHSVTIKWSQVREALGVKRDLITYQDNLIILITPGKKVALSEADSGFRLFEPHLIENLPGFPDDWYDQIEAQPLNSPIRLWQA